MRVCVYVKNHWTHHHRTWLVDSTWQVLITHFIGVKRSNVKVGVSLHSSECQSCSYISISCTRKSLLCNLHISIKTSLYAWLLCRPTIPTKEYDTMQQISAYLRSVYAVEPCAWQMLRRWCVFSHQAHFIHNHASNPRSAGPLYDLCG